MPSRSRFSGRLGIGRLADQSGPDSTRPPRKGLISVPLRVVLAGITPPMSIYPRVFLSCLRCCDRSIWLPLGLWLAVLATSSLSAQPALTGTIEGRVFDAGRGEFLKTRW
jgi:hypothetical protein